MAAAVIKAQLTDIGIAGAAKVRSTDSQDGILLLEPPHDVDGNIALGVKRVDHKAVGGVDSLFIAQVEHHQIAVYPGAAMDQLLGFFLVIVVSLDAFAHIVQGQNLINRVLLAVVDQLHHQLIVGDPEFTETPYFSPRIDDEIQQHPALRVKNLVLVKLTRVALIDGCHHVFPTGRKGIEPFVIVEH